MRNYVTHALGSVVGTVLNGVAENSYQFKPFCAVLAKTGSSTDPSFLWNGASGYRATLLSYSDVFIRRRHYSSTSGRWTTTDPVWPNEPAYAYAACHPIQYTDPSGLASCNLSATAVYVDVTWQPFWRQSKSVVPPIVLGRRRFALSGLPPSVRPGRIACVVYFPEGRSEEAFVIPPATVSAVDRYPKRSLLFEKMRNGKAVVVWPMQLDTFALVDLDLLVDITSMKPVVMPTAMKTAGSLVKIFGEIDSNCTSRPPGKQRHVLVSLLKGLPAIRSGVRIPTNCSIGTSTN